MTEVIGVKFREEGKVYYFDPRGTKVSSGKDVIVETSRGIEYGVCVSCNEMIEDNMVVQPLRPMLRLATDEDRRTVEENKKKEADAFVICEKKILEHGLDMKLVEVEYTLDGSKILFFFTSEGRVDFRELVKELASVFRARIELRQIGVRDEAKMLGGLGICGRPFCCHAFLDDFEPVSTKMAKTQSLSLNPTKISGSCGRLMCCLRYEQEAYEELVKTVPKNGAFVQTPCGYGNVCQVNLLRQKVKVKLDGADEPPKGFDADEVAAIPGGRPKPGEPLPDILVLKPKETEEEKTEISQWKMPPVFAEDTVVETPAAEKEESEHKKNSRSRNRSRSKKPSQGKTAPADAKAEKVQTAPAQQPKKAEGEGAQNKKKPSHKRKHSSSKPKEVQQPKTKESSEAKKSAQPKQAEQKKPQQNKGQGGQPKAQQPKSNQGGEKAEGSAPKKKNNYHRYRGKPKSKPAGGTSPKGE